MKFIKNTLVKIFLILAACLFLVSFSIENKTTSETVKVIKVAGDESFPPYEFLESNGIYRGFNVDIMNAIAVETGVHIEIIPMEWQEALNALGDGEVDAIQGMTKSLNREKVYLFSDDIVTNSQVIFVLNNTETISDVSDLQGHTVAIQKGDITMEKLNNVPNIKIVFTENQSQAMNLLLEGKVDSFIGNRLVGLYNLQKTKMSENVKIVGEPLNVSQYCSAALKGNDGILNVLNKGIKAIKNNGTYEKIYSKWFGESFHNRAKMHKKYLVIFLIGAALLIVLIVIYALINKGLKRAIDERTSELAVANEKLESINQLLVKEIDERKKVEDLVWHQAHFDYLTGLPNRRLFIDKLDKAIRKAKYLNRKVAVFFIDLDNFKDVNDRLGHEYGDNLLKRFGERLLEVCGSAVIVSRFGGDEFTIVLENIKHIREVNNLLQKLNESMKEPYIINKHSINQYASIGVSIYPESGKDADALLNSADYMMYEVKEKGKKGNK